VGVSVRSSRGRSTQDIIDDSSPISPEDILPESPIARKQVDPIELESSFISPSQSSEQEVERSPKRRRISISPDLQTSQSAHVDDPSVILDVPDELEDPEEQEDQDEPDASPEPERSSQLQEDLWLPEDQQRDEQEDPITTQAEYQSDYETQSEADILDKDTNAQAHPTFHRAPRFKASEHSADGPQEHYLPDAFSPQRRGAKYVPGGLAAELRDWLVEVKGYDADQQGLPTAVGLNVTSVRHGVPGMCLVEGRPEAASGFADNVPVRAILAGEGRISGLGKPNVVVPGSTVMVSPPAWDVQLGTASENWTVACDWAVD
jgi:hypothetical protein